MPTRDLLQALRDHGVGEYFDLLAENRVDLDILQEITADDLRELGIPLGDRKRILHLASELAGAIPSAAENMQRGVPEIRQISVLFADLAGSTPMAEALDIEEYHAALALFHECCSGVVREEGGFAARYVGDAVLACFGYPIASEEDAIHAARAGLRIADCVPSLKAARGYPLNARVGIATGVAMTGDLVADGARAFGPATGATLNLAARLQGVAEPDTVVVDAETHRLLGTDFICEALGEHRLKGFDEPKPLWRVRKQTAGSPAFRPHENALVGRSDDLDLLRTRLEAAPRKGSIGLLTGEAGIGKSRLVDEFILRASEAGERPVLRMECSASETLRPLHPVISGIEAVSGLATLDGDGARLERLNRWVAEDLRLSPRTAEILADLLSLGEADAFAGIQPKERRAGLFGTLVQVLERLSLHTPLIAVLEDMHWIDPTTEEFLDHLVETAGSLRLLLLCTCRPDYTPTFIGKPRVFVISLSRLEQGEVMAMLRGVPGAGALPPDVAEDIANRTEGVPLFVEELTKSVIETRRSGKDAAKGDSTRPLPTTLLGSLLARLDRVPESRRIAPIGAAIGRSFAHSLVVAVSGLAEQAAETILNGLISSGLLSKHGRGADAVYTFKHALVQDAAYETLPKSRRIAIHMAIADTLANGPAATRPDVLARHYFAAEDYVRASQCWLAAAQDAQRASASEEAVAYIRFALDANERTPSDDARRDREIELREAMYVPLEITRLGSHEIEDNLERVRHFLRDDPEHVDKLLDVMHGLSGYHLIGGQVAKARALAEEIIERFGPDHRLAPIMGHRLLAFCCFMSGAFDDAIANFEHVVRLAREFDPGEVRGSYESDPVLISSTMICWAHALRNPSEDIGACLADVRRLIDAAESKWDRAFALSIFSSTYQTLGDPEACLRIASEAFPIAEDRQFEYWIGWSQVLRGWSIARIDSPELGIADIETGIERYRATGAVQMVPYGKLLLAEARLLAGATDEARSLVTELTERRDPVEIRYIDGSLRRLAGRLNREGGGATPPS